jgi:hypothetical protein
MLALSMTAFAQLNISVSFGPPALPVYEQPVCPNDGYIWTPGYWAWDPDAQSYYWVPGTWVEAPQVGYLWTPPWWGWEAGFYVFHPGWWGPHVGFYGGINYGFGYFGNGFWGGRWEGRHFFYNREVANVNVVNIRNVYNEHVTIVNNTHVAFNGGGGVQARPSPQEEQWAHERHIGPVAAQTQHIDAARSEPALRAAVNRGKPPIAATDRPGNFKGNVVPAREAGAEYRPAEHEAHPGAAGAPERAPAVPTHVKELPPAEKMPPPNTGNAKLDQQYQKQQQKLQAQQEKERQNIEKQQEREHAQLAKQNASAEKQQQVEQKHQQQTQALVQKHAQQRQELQTRQAAAPKEPEGKR